jgi:hypothetical protein
MSRCTWPAPLECAPAPPPHRRQVGALGKRLAASLSASTKQALSAAQAVVAQVDRDVGAVAAQHGGGKGGGGGPRRGGGGGAGGAR